MLLVLLFVALVSAADFKFASFGTTDYSARGDGSNNDFVFVSKVETSGVLAQKQFSQILAANFHALVVTTDGNVLGWGRNVDGQIGTNNNLTNVNVPIASEFFSSFPGKQVKVLSSRWYHTIALTTDNLLVAWGDGTFGALGDGSLARSNVPIAVNMTNFNGKTISRIATAEDCSAALTTDGELYIWGKPRHLDVIIPIPTLAKNYNIDIQEPIVEIVGGRNHFLMQTQSGNLFAFGDNSYGQLADGTIIARNTSVKVNIPGKITKIAAGTYHNLALNDNNQLYIWGYTIIGDKDLLSPKIVTLRNTGGEAIDSIYCGWETSYFLTVTGKLFSWGAGQWRALGDGTANSRLVPEVVDPSYYDNLKISRLTCSRYCLALMTNNAIYSWGENEYGQLGSGLPTVKPRTDNTKGSFVSFDSTYTNQIVRIKGKWDTVMFLDNTNVLYAFGANNYGQIGDGSLASRSKYVKVDTTALGVKTIKDFAVSSHGVLVTEDNLLFGWGNNQDGQIDSTQNLRLSPTSISLFGSALQGKGIKKVAAGCFHSLVLTDDNQVFAWGSNNIGQLGLGSKTVLSTAVPTKIVDGALAGKTIKDISAGCYHNLILTDDDMLYSFGSGNFGSLGYGGFDDQAAPITVNMTEIKKTPQAKIKFFDAAEDNSIVVTDLNEVFIWGSFLYTPEANPVRMSIPDLNGATITRASLGGRQVFLYADNGNIYSMGLNSQSQLADGTTNDRSVFGRATLMESSVNNGKILFLHINRANAYVVFQDRPFSVQAWHIVVIVVLSIAIVVVAGFIIVLVIITQKKKTVPEKNIRDPALRHELLEDEENL